MANLGGRGTIQTGLFKTLRGAQSSGKGVMGAALRGQQQLPPGTYRLSGGAGGRPNMTIRVVPSTTSGHIGPTTPMGETSPDKLD